jgi:tellurite resistance protein TerC
MDWSVIAIILQLIFLEGILSIDNAAILGAMAAPLPNDKPVPWPAPLAWLADTTTPLLGMQREAALKVGLIGAYAGRFVMLLIASVIIQSSWLRMLGALYLIYLAVNHIAQMDHDHTAEEHHPSATPVRAGRGFWSTVATIELADLAFSLDNVVAAITLSDQLWVIMVGVGIGILMMRFAATIFTRLIGWEPALQTGAFLLVFSLGIILLLKEIFHIHLSEATQFLISVSILGATVLVARSSLAHVRPLGQGAIALFKVLYLPFGAVIWLLQALIRPLRRSTNRAGSGD